MISNENRLNSILFRLIKCDIFWLYEEYLCYCSQLIKKSHKTSVEHMLEFRGCNTKLVPTVGSVSCLQYTWIRPFFLSGTQNLYHCSHMNFPFPAKSILAIIQS